MTTALTDTWWSDYRSLIVLAVSCWLYMVISCTLKLRNGARQCTTVVSGMPNSFPKCYSPLTTFNRPDLGQGLYYVRYSFDPW